MRQSAMRPSPAQQLFNDAVCRQPTEVRYLALDRGAQQREYPRPSNSVLCERTVSASLAYRRVRHGKVHAGPKYPSGHDPFALGIDARDNDSGAIIVRGPAVAGNAAQHL